MNNSQSRYVHGYITRGRNTGNMLLGTPIKWPEVLFSSLRFRREIGLFAMSAVFQEMALESLETILRDPNEIQANRATQAPVSQEESQDRPRHCQHLSIKFRGLWGESEAADTQPS